VQARFVETPQGGLGDPAELVPKRLKHAWRVPMTIHELETGQVLSGVKASSLALKYKKIRRFTGTGAVSY
jgi:hypothetical protein